MAEYRIKGETLAGIADAIRKKTGGTEPIPVPDMAAQIEGISGGGGGSSADVCYVTFMSHDGTVELGKKAVAVGDDCADPIARGVFDRPTRESDAQYDYDHAGWSKNPDNVLDDTALDAVTEDRVVYAVYAATVRYYTITYYDSDGTTVLKTESLAYGAVPSSDYAPEKDGYAFDGWEPTLATVTGDTSYIAVWTETITFANATWEQVVEICEAGNAEKNFAVGDTKTLVFTDLDGAEVTTTVGIVGFEHDDLSDESGKAAISIMCMAKACTVPHASTDYAEGSNGWAGSTLRTNMQSLLTHLPAALQTGIKQVTKTSRIYVDGTDTTGTVTSEDKIWIPSLGEAGVTGVISGYGVSGGDGNKYEGFSQDNMRSMAGSGRTCYRSGSYTIPGKWVANIGNGWGPMQSSWAATAYAFGFCI